MNDATRQEIADLLSRHFDGYAEESDTQRLKELLRDEAARNWYYQNCQMHAMLRWEHGDLPTVEFDDVSPATRGVSRTKTAPWPWLAVMALGLLGAVTLWQVVTRLEPVDTAESTSGVLASDSQSSPAEPADADPIPAVFVGVLEKVESPVWENSALPVTPGELISSGTLELQSGKVQIALFGGARLTLHGPCLLDLPSKYEGYLHRGDIMVSVDSDDVRLTINTPIGELIHLGTEFGVSVAASGETDMFVYEGTVQITPPTSGQTAPSSRLVGQGTAVRLEPSGRVGILSPQQMRAFRESTAADAESPRFIPRPPVISPAGFTVRYVKAHSFPIDSLAAAEALLAGNIVKREDVTVEGLARINFRDHPHDSPLSEYDRLFSEEQPFPGDAGGFDEKDENFAILATATLLVQDAWEYSFLLNIDDGARLRVDDQVVIIDNGNHPPQVSIGTLVLAAGSHNIELIAYDHTAFARVELGIATGDTRNTEAFRLLGTQ